MDIKFDCPNCQQPIVVDDSGAGTTINCPSCQSTINVPKSAIRVTPEPRPNLWRCSACHGFYSKRAYACPHCGDPIKSPIPTLFYIVAILYLAIGIIGTLLFLSSALTLAR